MKAFAKLTQLVDGEPRIVSDPPLIVSAADLAQEAGISFERLESVIHELFREYRETLQDDRRHLLEEFRMVDLARKVVGVGSVGTRCWIVLLLGRDGDDPLFLQIKEAQASVLEPYLGKSEYENHGQRVVAGQRLMQTTSDIFLGWLHSSENLDGRRATSSSASSGTGRRRSTSTRSCRRASSSTARSAASCSRARTRARATGSPSPPTSARATRSTARSPSSRSRTPTRTSATTPR